MTKARRRKKLAHRRGLAVEAAIFALIGQNRAWGGRPVAPA